MLAQREAAVDVVAILSAGRARVARVKRLLGSRRRNTSGEDARFARHFGITLERRERKWHLGPRGYPRVAHNHLEFGLLGFPVNREAKRTPNLVLDVCGPVTSPPVREREFATAAFNHCSLSGLKPRRHRMRCDRTSSPPVGSVLAVPRSNLGLREAVQIALL